ncbi:MAG TPA: hypothetical protein DCP92_05565 [Nitrospiraceae bacterium]|nr:hypothetical protein [Nitrospiraceae bacterium]
MQERRNNFGFAPLPKTFFEQIPRPNTLQCLTGQLQGTGRACPVDFTIQKKITGASSFLLQVFWAINLFLFLLSRNTMGLSFFNLRMAVKN